MSKQLFYMQTMWYALHEPVAYLSKSLKAHLKFLPIPKDTVDIGQKRAYDYRNTGQAGYSFKGSLWCLSDLAYFLTQSPPALRHLRAIHKHQHTFIIVILCYQSFFDFINQFQVIWVDQGFLRVLFVIHSCPAILKYFTKYSYHSFHSSLYAAAICLPMNFSHYLHVVHSKMNNYSNFTISNVFGCGIHVGMVITNLIIERWWRGKEEQKRSNQLVNLCVTWVCQRLNEKYGNSCQFEVTPCFESFEKMFNLDLCLYEPTTKA